ncbi:MAG: hypothetical protein M1819_004046 [Sarea resinae]|nr:MAG: hypothetical protein M1819_004046 [Sarea resinae]
MASVVELSAAANPLTSQTLFHVLQAAASTYQQQVQTGTQQLQSWEKQSGYYSLLQTAFIDKSLPFEIRYLAIIQLKNGIDKYWRKTASNAISKDEKALIRSRLLDSGINEEDPRLALQNALVVAKIVRYEFPNDWPDAFTSLIGLLRSGTEPSANSLHLPRTLLILLHLIKELATGRLQRTRTSLQSVTPELFHVLGRIYVDKVSRWRAMIDSGGYGEGSAFDDIEQSLLAIKVLRRLVIAGYEFPNREKDVQEFWTILRNHFGDFWTLASRGPDSFAPPVFQLIERHTLQVSKLHLEMVRVHPAAFALLPDSIGLVRAYWSVAADFGESFGSKTAITSALAAQNGHENAPDSITERISLKGLLVIRACLKMVFSPVQTFKYKHQEEKDERKESTQLMRESLLTPDFVCTAMEVIVTRFFVFRANDLQEWEEEPEEWEKKEESEAEGWEFSVRACSEKLFLDLILHFKTLLVQPLLNVFYSVSSPENENILFKDSVYTAIGLSASSIYSQLDFDNFLNTTLVAEVQKQKPGYSILRRRIAILLGQWVFRVSKDNRPLVYQIFQHLLDKNDQLNDQVVRITAGKSFRDVADEWEFEANAFVPYAPEILGRLMALIEEVELTETKMALLNTVSVIVERLEHHIAPYADKIVSLLPPLWEQSGEEHLMKQAILTILSRLINAMKDESRRYHSMVLPLIKSAVEPGSETQVYLLEDALDLWSSVLAQTPSPASADIISIAPYLFSIFELGTENLRKALEITESYVLLAPREMLDDQMRDRFLGAFSSLLGTLKSDANGLLTHLVEVIIRAADSLGGEQAVSIVATSIIGTGLLFKLADGLRGSWEAHQTTGPNRRDPPVDGIVETDYLSVLARLALASPTIFTTSIQSISTGRNEPYEQTVDWILTEWFSHFENIGDPSNRKLMCLALTRLLETNQKWILTHLQDLMTVWTDIITELQEGAEDRGGDSLVYWDANGLKPQNSPEAPEEERKRNLTFSDPVHTVNAPEFIKLHLQTAIAACGSQEAFRDQWLVNVDQEVVSAFGALGIL